MEIKILKEDKNELDVEISNLTVVELMRVYANKQTGIDFAAWRRDHPTKNPVLHIKGIKPKVILKKAIEAAQKDLGKAVSEFKDLK